MPLVTGFTPSLYARHDKLALPKAFGQIITYKGKPRTPCVTAVWLDRTHRGCGVVFAPPMLIWLWEPDTSLSACMAAAWRCLLAMNPSSSAFPMLRLSHLNGCSPGTTQLCGCGVTNRKACGIEIKILCFPPRLTASFGSWNKSILTSHPVFQLFSLSR